MPLAVSLNYVLLDATLSLIAFVVGFGLAYLLLKSGAESAGQSRGDKTRQAEQEILAEERTNMAIMQLKDLAGKVASDVGAHNQLVTGISDRLETLDKNSPDSGIAVADAVAQIVAANAKLQERLEEAERKIQTQAEQLKSQQSEARTDSLTKLPNRRAFDDALAEGIEQYRSHKRPLSLVLFDVDHFKKFNDTYGHQAGDEVLRGVAAALRQTAKSTDLPCRYGGEEFALVMANTTISQAKVAVERVREAIAETIIDFENLRLNVTASMGVAEVGPDDDVKSIIRRSDEAIYSAKSSGRNCSYWHDGELCRPIDDPGETSPTEVPAAPARSPWSLADLPDHETFTRELQRRVSECHRTGSSLAVMSMRIVGYSALERDYGLAVVDMVQDCVAQLIGSKLRDMDLFGRVQDGEFIIMLPGSTEREAAIVGNRVQTALSKCPVPLGSSKITLHLTRTISGVQPDDSAETLLERVLVATDAAQPVALGR